MSELSKEEVKRHMRIYLCVFVALAILTAVTVTVSYLRLPILLAMGAALFIATFKGSLVAGFFMHLASERKIIFVVLVFAFIFFLALLLLPSISRY